MHIGPLDGATCISCKFGHHMHMHHLHCFQSCPSGCVTCIATLPWIALLALLVSIELSARVTSVKSTQGLSVTDGNPDPKIGPQVYLGPIKGRHLQSVLPCFAPPVLSISRVEAGQGLLFAGRGSLLFRWPGQASLIWIQFGPCC